MQYITLNKKFSNLQLKKLKSEMQNGIHATLNLLSTIVVDYSNDETNFPHKFFFN